MKKTTLVVCLLFATHLIYSHEALPVSGDEFILNHKVMGNPIAVAPTPISGLSNSEFSDIQLVVDESALAQSNPVDNVADRLSTADFSNLFGIVDYGTDGPGSVVFGLSITNDIGMPVNGLASGLFALDANASNGKGAEILLFVNAGVIEGRAGSSTGDLYFTISNIGSEITIIQSSMNMWHPDSNSHNDSVSLNGMSGSGNTVTYFINLVQTITDTDGDSDSAVLNLTEANVSGGSVEYVFNFFDDGPTAFDDYVCADDAQTNNVVLVIDTSGSMGSDSGVNNPNSSGNYTRMEVLQNIIEQLLTSYESLGTLNVQIVSFAGNSTYHGWFSVDGNNSTTENAMDIINSLPSNGSSDYDDALQLVIDSYNDDAPSSYADNTTLYFLSDGNPTTDANKQATLDFESTWELFFNTAGNDIASSYAIGIGAGITTTDYLDVVSYGNSDTIPDPNDPRFRGEDNTIIVEDFNDLSIVLVGTILSSSGNVLEGTLSAGGMSDNYGTDGAGQIIAFEHDGTTYSASSFGASHTITTAAGGTFTFYFEDVGVNSIGGFNYTASTVSVIDITEVFTYTIQDADGDTASANLEICVDYEVLSIEDVSFSNLNYYPNPVLNILHINSVNAITKTIFYDINGKKLLEEIHQSDEVELKVDKFKTGVYFLEVYSNNQTKTLKIIKGE